MIFRVFNKMLYQKFEFQESSNPQPPAKENILRAFIRRTSDPMNDIKMSKIVNIQVPYYFFKMFQRDKKHDSSKILFQRLHIASSFKGLPSIDEVPLYISIK